MHVPRCGRNEAQEEKTSCVGLSLAGGFHIQVSGSCPHPHPQLCAPSVLSAAKWVFLAPLSHQGDGRWSHESAGLTAQPRPSVGGGGLLSPDHADLPWPGCLWEPPKECGGGGGHRRGRVLPLQPFLWSWAQGHTATRPVCTSAELYRPDQRLCLAHTGSERQALSWVQRTRPQLLSGKEAATWRTTEDGELGVKLWRERSTFSAAGLHTHTAVQQGGPFAPKHGPGPPSAQNTRFQGNIKSH